MPGSRQYADVARDPDNRPPDGVAVLRVEGGLYFANADAVRGHVLTGAARDGVHAPAGRDGRWCPRAVRFRLAPRG